MEDEHRRILLHDPNWLFNQEAIWKRTPSRGEITLLTNQDPVLLTIVSKAPPIGRAKERSPMYKICRGPAEADAFFHEVSAMSGALTMFRTYHIGAPTCGGAGENGTAFSRT